MIFIGFDPGINGGIGIVDANGVFKFCDEIPTITSGKSREVDASGLTAMLRGDAYFPTKAICCVEKVGSMPGQGVASTFNFGRAYGAILGVLGAFGIQRVDVTPQTWKKHFHLIGTDKEASRGLAVKLFPAAGLTRKKDHGLAEALLMAKWLRDTHGGYSWMK
jgi:crossover junction endodeoxyribonuclease RuvC